MGVASMVIGIISLVIGFVPMCGFWAAVPAVIGLILGIVDLVLRSKRKQPRGKAIVGVILNPLAIIVIVAWFVMAGYGVEWGADQPIIGQGQGWQQPMPGWGTGPAQQAPVPLQPTPQPVPLQPMQPMQPMQPVPPDPGAPQPSPPPPPPPPQAP